MEYINDMLILHGGIDIDPAYYNEKPHPETDSPNKERDRREWGAIKDAMENNIPVVGICRGAQLLCIANGGRLWQHAGGHGQSHLMKTIDGRMIKTTSAHHQLMDCTNTEHNIIAWTPFPTKVFTEDEEAFLLQNAPEVVWFPKHKHLAIQGHPEWAPNTVYSEYINGLIQQFIGKEGVF